MSRTVSVGLAQITGTPGVPDTNRQLSLAAAELLFDKGADVVVLPELIASGYSTDPELMRGAAESVEGPTVTAWETLAKGANGVIVGGFCERVGDALFNSAVAVGGSGLILHYRKLHLFSTEKQCFVPGDRGLPVAETPFGTLAVCVCYDLRFVETARALSLQGAALICVPTAWLPGFDNDLWDEHGFCPQARNAMIQANLDQVFIACASQAGASGGYQFLGSSLVSDPYGKPLLGPLPGSAPALATVELDLDAAREAQDRDLLINPRRDRRTDVYGLSVSGTIL